jgi:hypothetical protein
MYPRPGYDATPADREPGQPRGEHHSTESPMRHVRCLFRVLSVSKSYDNAVVASIAPTFATRDGRQSDENKAFFEATPSGAGELRLGPGAAALELFAPGAYLYLDFYRDEPGEDHPVPQGGVRTDWLVDSVEVSWNSFQPKLYARRGEYDYTEKTHNNGRNAAVFGGGPAMAEIRMSINNLHAWPFFAFAPDAARTVKDAAVVIDFSPA